MYTKSDLGFHAYIRGIILIGFALLMLAFVITGKINYYLSPAMKPFVYFSIIVFLLLGVIQIFRSTSKAQEEEMFCDCGNDHSMSGSPLTKLVIYSIFIAPILLGFVLPDKLLDSTVVANRGIQFGSGLEKNSASSNEGSTARAEAFLNDPEQYYKDLEAKITEAPQEEGEITSEEFFTEEGYNEYYQQLTDEVLARDQIIVTEENYLDMMTVLEIELEKFQGMPIEIVGFVYREPEFNDNQLVVARFGMTCCVADSYVYGTMVTTTDANQFENDTWVRVTGIIDQTVYNDVAIPLIQVQQIDVIEQPENPYVYPRFSY